MGRYAAYAAFASLLVLLARIVYLVLVFNERPDPRDLVANLLLLAQQKVAFIVAAAAQSLSVLLLGIVLFYLYRATVYRRPETPRAALVLSIIGALLVAAMIVIEQLAAVNAAGKLAESAVKTRAFAEELVSDGPAGVIAQVGAGTRLALGLAIVLIGVNAMRAGLLSRFMGILGVVLGALYAVSNIAPILSPQPVLYFWVGALGVLFLGRWPAGRGPAWETGEATPWPSAAEQRAELERQREAGGGESGAGESGEGGNHDPADDRDHDRGGGEQSGAGGAARRKRKRRSR